MCQGKHSTCVDAQYYPNGQYVGHDEPSIEFKSNLPGSGNNMTYTMVLPRDPKVQPNASGDWPGTNPNPVVDLALHPTPVMFTSPLTRGRNYSTIAFENDMPFIEQEGAQLNPPFCDVNTGVNCVNPPHGAAFYPFYSTTLRQGECTWQEGGKFIPGTVNDFGGSSTTEYGSLLRVLFPEPGFTTVNVFADFNSGNMTNPCPAQ